jgi:hypothetical protein
VLGSAMVFLQSEAGFELDLNMLNLKATSLVNAIIPPPWEIHFAVQSLLLAFCFLQLGDDVFDA